jgi:hypothetical protein
MYTLDVSMTSIFIRPIEGGGGDGEDAGGLLPFLVSKLVFTMQPPPRKSQDANIDTPRLKLTLTLILNLHLKGFTFIFSSSYYYFSSMQQQEEKIAIAGSANGSRNEVLTNFELKLDNKIPPPPPPPPPKVAIGKINVVTVVVNYGAIDSLR